MENINLINDIMNVIEEKTVSAWPHKRVRYHYGRYNDIPLLGIKATPGFREEIDANEKYVRDNNISLRNNVSKEVMDYRFVAMEVISWILEKGNAVSFSLYAETIFNWLGVTDKNMAEKESDNNFWRNFILAMYAMANWDAYVIKLYDEVPTTAWEYDTYNFKAESYVGSETEDIRMRAGHVLAYFGIAPGDEYGIINLRTDLKEYFEFFNLEKGLEKQGKLYPSYFRSIMIKEALATYGTPYTYVYDERYNGYHD